MADGGDGFMGRCEIVETATAQSPMAIGSESEDCRGELSAWGAGCGCGTQITICSHITCQIGVAMPDRVGWLCRVT